MSRNITYIHATETDIWICFRFHFHFYTLFSTRKCLKLVKAHKAGKLPSFGLLVLYIWICFHSHFYIFSLLIVSEWSQLCLHISQILPFYPTLYWIFKKIASLFFFFFFTLSYLSTFSSFFPFSNFLIKHFSHCYSVLIWLLADY